MPEEPHSYEFLRSIVTGWLGKIAQAKKAKKAFNAIAKQCMAFYSADLGFMWEPEFREQYMGGEIRPKFKITVAKAFELVAVIGPVLYWRYANRVCRNYEPFELVPEVFGPADDPLAQQMFDAAIAEQQQELAICTTRNSLMEKYLNYSQREQPDGLHTHSELAITEALVKGRGTLWVEPYSPPGSDAVLTGCFYDSVDNFFVDPDCDDPTLRGAMWVCRRHFTPSWKLERMWDLPKGSLDGKGTFETADSQGTNDDEGSKQDRREGKTFDGIEWYEIWSKGGVGTRLKGVSSGLHEAFDDVVGDYAYIAVAPNVPYPLNAPSKRMKSADDDEVREMFAWPVEYWRDQRWPVVCLDFYRKPKCAWPLAPMAMGLGELMFMNVMLSLLCNRVWSSTRDIIAYLKSAAQNVEAQLKSGNYQCFIEINDGAHKSINEIIQYLKQPDVSFDIFRTIEVVAEMFDKRVGLTELVYGLNPGGAASRTATDVKAKQEQISVRPDYMAGKVEQWQSDAAQLEKLAAQRLNPEHLRPLLGRTGVAMWQQLITDEDQEVVMREMKAMVEAGSARKPNKARDAENLSGLLDRLVPLLQQYAIDTGDSEPINALFEQLGEAIDQDMSAWELGPWRPEPDPAAAEQQQAMVQLEMAKLQSDAEARQMDAQAKQVDIQTRMLEAELKAKEGADEEMKRRLDLVFESLKQKQKLTHDAQSHGQDLLQDRIEHLQEMFQRRQESAERMGQMKQEGQLKLRMMKAQQKERRQAAKSKAGSKA